MVETDTIRAPKIDAAGAAQLGPRAPDPDVSQSPRSEINPANGTFLGQPGPSSPLHDLVAWWRLDETEGLVATDSSGRAHHGLLMGNPQWQPGHIGGALAFDGQDDCVSIGDTPDFDISASITVSAWIKGNAFDKQHQAIVTKGDTAWRLQRSKETDTLVFVCTGVRLPDNNQWGRLSGTLPITLKEWHHIAGVYDGQRMYLYVDGTLDASQPASGRIKVNNDPVLIGENSEERNRFWNGMIDDVRIYSCGLTAQQIKTLSDSCEGEDAAHSEGTISRRGNR